MNIRLKQLLILSAAMSVLCSQSYAGEVAPQARLRSLGVNILVNQTLGNGPGHSSYPYKALQISSHVGVEGGPGNYQLMQPVENFTTEVAAKTDTYSTIPSLEGRHASITYLAATDSALNLTMTLQLKVIAQAKSGASLQGSADIPFTLSDGKVRAFSKSFSLLSGNTSAGECTAYTKGGATNPLAQPIQIDCTANNA